MSFLDPNVIVSDSHYMMEKVYRATKTKYINVDTLFQDDSKCITFPQVIQNVKQITVENLELPIQYYNFSRTRNTFCSITLNGNVFPILIPDANYTTTQLITALNTSLAVHYTDLSFNFVQNRVVFQTTKLYTLSFAVDSNGNFDKSRLKSKLGWCLGFRKPSYQVNGNLQAEGAIQLASLRYLFLVLDDFSSFSPNSFIAPIPGGYLPKSTLARLSMDSNISTFGSITAFSKARGNFLSDVRTYGGKTDIQKIQIQLVDEWGKNIDLNQTDFSFCLRLDYE